MTDMILGTVPEVTRFPTGCASLDVCLGDSHSVGGPLRCLWEIYGKWASGKSSLAYYLAGRAAYDKQIELADLESSLDPRFLKNSLVSAGFLGKVHVVDSGEKIKGKIVPRAHEDMLEDIAISLFNDEVRVVVLDSIGGMMPKQEAAALLSQKGKLGEAQMGRRAKSMNDWSRMVASLVRQQVDPKIVIAVNHQMDEIGGRGHSTPGGATFKYLASVRLWMYRKQGGTEDDGSFHAVVKPEKLKYGGTAKDKIGNVFIIPEFGLSPDMTAVIDCFEYGLADREPHGVKVKGGRGMTKVGRFKQLTEFAREGNHEKFAPFYEALNAMDTNGAEQYAKEGSDGEDE